MKQKRLLSMLVLLAAVVSGAWGQNSTTYNVTFGGFSQAGMNITVSVASLPQTFTQIGDYNLYPWQVLSNGDEFTSVSVTSGGEGKVSANKAAWNQMTITVTGTFEGTATIHVTGIDENQVPVSGDITVSCPAPPQLYTVSMKDGVKDADKWTVKAGEGEYQALPLEGVAAGTAVSVKYNGTKKVKSVKAVKKAAADNTYLKWNAGQLVKTDIPAEVTMVANADTDVNWEAGTYVVEGEVTISGSIALNGNVDLIIKDGAKLTVNNYILGYASYNLSIFGQSNQTGELVVNSSLDAIEDIKTLEVHSAKVKATSSGNNNDGFYNIQTFNVYGGTVDAESTGTNGNGILLYSSGSMNIYGGDVKALGKGNKFGIAGSLTKVTVSGGKLWAGCFNNKAIDASNVTLKRGDGFTGKIETSGNGESWTNWEPSTTPGTNYVRVGY